MRECAQVVERLDCLPDASTFRCCHRRDHRPTHTAGVSTVACGGGIGGGDGDGGGGGGGDGDGGAGSATASSAAAGPVYYRLAVYSYRRMATLPEWRAGPTSALVGTITTSATSTVSAHAAGTTAAAAAPEGRASACAIKASLLNRVHIKVHTCKSPYYKMTRRVESIFVARRLPLNRCGSPRAIS